MEKIINVEGLTVPIKIIKTDRKTCTIQIYPDGKVVIRTPLKMTDNEIKKLINSKFDFIEKNVQKYLKNKKEIENLGNFTAEDIRRMAEKAAEIIPERVRFYADKLGVTYGRITIRNQKTKWGSCSQKGNLNFNCLLVEMPFEVLDSVVAHEVCHRKHMNHSRDFYTDLYKIYPEYDKWNNWLKKNGAVFIQRMTNCQ